MNVRNKVKQRPQDGEWWRHTDIGGPYPVEMENLSQGNADS